MIEILFGIAFSFVSIFAIGGWLNTIKLSKALKHLAETKADKI